MIPVQIQSDDHKINEGDGQSVFYTVFTPKTKPVLATVLVIHGMQEHSGRYEALALYFADQGFAVLTYDHPGHGKSVPDALAMGFFREVDPDGLLISVADEMKNILKERYPEVSHFVLGHSMGSFITRCLLQQSGSAFDGAVIVGTGGPLVGIGLIKRYFLMANRLNPHRRPGFNNLFSKVNNIRFSRDKDYSPTSWLSLNPENRINFEKDSLCGQPFTNNGFLGLFSLYRQATQKGWTTRIPKSLPFLFVSGADDPIGGFGKGVQKSVEDLKKDNFNDVDVELYKYMRHEILNESIRQDVFKDVHTWMLKWIK